MLLRSRPDLLARFRAGDRDALTEVYWHYVDRVETIVRHGYFVSHKNLRVDGAHADEIGDLVQEIFARAFSERARLGYDGLRDYQPYLATIARNLLTDWARKRGRELPIDALPDEPAENAEIPFADERTIAIVEDYLAKLPADLRAVHQQRYVLGRSQEAAAAALSISRQTLRTRENALREGLSRLLK